ncbi:MAG: 50S ribosomal protein L11 methyltransferase [Candidatus Abyssubacteria bacterium]
MKEPKIWHKVTMSVSKDSADMLRNAMQSLPCSGIQSEDDSDGERLDAYFDDAIDPADLQKHLELIAELIAAASGKDSRKLQLGAIETIPEEDWAEEWRRNWKPIKVSRRLVVCPSWIQYPALPGQTVIFIYPRMAFGTGSHATTQLCLKLLDRHVPQGGTVLDIGAGSAILSIAAVKLGARRAVAIEMDEAAIDNARENCRLNRVASKVKIVCDRFGPHTRGHFDLGVCNMLAHEMLPLIPDIIRLLRGKPLIISGLTKNSAAEIKKEFKRHGRRIAKRLVTDEWIAFYVPALNS